MNLLIRLAAAWLLSAAGLCALAQPYPNKPKRN